MNKRLIRFMSCAFALLLLMTVLCTAAFAAETGQVRYTDPETGYEAVILDDADVLTEAQEASLTEYMMPITKYGSIVFWSTEEYTFDVIDQAKEKRASMYGRDSSGIFSINMNTRDVTFQSDGSINTRVSASLARSVTDNVSHYASSGDYYSCAAECFTQIESLLEGNRIAEPMKYISYVVIALMLSFVIVVSVVFSGLFNPMMRENRDKALLRGKGNMFEAPPTVKKTGYELRAWLQVLLFIMRMALASGGSGGSGGSSSSGGGSSGGSGGSSSF